MTLRRMPPSPDIMVDLYMDYRRKGVKGVSFRKYLELIGFTDPGAQEHGMDDGHMFTPGPPHGPALIDIPAQPITGTLHVVVLMVDFDDRQGLFSREHYEELLFSEETYPTGSMRDYFQEVTLGKVTVTGTVHGWLRMPRTYAYYTNEESGTRWGSYPRNVPRMAEDAVREALASGVQFPGNLDALNNGTITALFLIHAGLGAEVIRNAAHRAREIWSHKWVLREPVSVGPGLTAATYLTVPHDCKLGVCAHELGHLAFQWQDFYDPNYDEDGEEWDGAGNWDLMAGGSYNGSSHSPAHPAGLHKSQHNWIDVETVRTTTTVTLPPFTPTTCKIARVVSQRYRTGQYLILENRVRAGFDQHLPGEGLLVWRVDERAEQVSPNEPGLLLVQADGRHHLENPSDWNQGDAGDPFPGSAGRTSLAATGSISTSFPGRNSGVSLENIHRDPTTGDITIDVVFSSDASGSTAAMTRAKSGGGKTARKKRKKRKKTTRSREK